MRKQIRISILIPELFYERTRVGQSNKWHVWTECNFKQVQFMESSGHFETCLGWINNKNVQLNFFVLTWDWYRKLYESLYQDMNHVTTEGRGRGYICLIECDAPPSTILHPYLWLLCKCLLVNKTQSLEFYDFPFLCLLFSEAKGKKTEIFFVFANSNQNVESW